MEYLFHFKASLLFFQTAVIAVALATTTGPWLWLSKMWLWLLSGWTLGPCWSPWCCRSQIGCHKGAQGYPWCWVAPGVIDDYVRRTESAAACCIMWSSVQRNVEVPFLLLTHLLLALVSFAGKAPALWAVCQSCRERVRLHGYIYSFCLVSL